MDIDFRHEASLHTVTGAEAALRALFETLAPASILDVGCSPGCWLAAARNIGVTDLCGVDGIQADSAISLTDRFDFIQLDLRTPIDLRRRFDLVICLEVGEHLDEDFAPVLIDSLVRHSDVCLFSAAAPGQGGTHHVNCQWPEYWQRLFNDRGYLCSDEFRWKIWDDSRIEPWYRQNVLLATKNDALAGRETRIRRVLHPGVLETFSHNFLPNHVRQIEKGSMPGPWYFRTALGAMVAKSRRRLLLNSKKHS